jgi:hypothetical protein
MAAEVMVMVVVTAVVATCMVVHTVMAGMDTRIVVMVGQAMLIMDLLMARVMVVLATVILITGIMAGGITVTGTPAMVAGGVATGTVMVLERAGASGQQ